MARPLPLVRGEVIEAWGDPEVQAYFHDSYRLGTPPPAGLLTQAHNPDVMRAWCRFWWSAFHHGTVDHGLKEILRFHLAHLSACHA